MRSYKFRVYDKFIKKLRDTGIFVLDMNGNLIDNSGYIINNKHLVVEWCTGMEDKHGTLIYEGDIIKYGGTVYTVYFCNHMN